MMRQNRKCGPMMTRCFLLLAFFMLLTFVATESEANLIPDPSMEKGTAVWTMGNYTTTIDNTIARSGSKSIKVVNVGAKPSHNAYQYNIPGFQPGKEYTYTVWVKGTKVDGHGTGGKPMSVLRWKDSANNKILDGLYMWAWYGTYDWRQVKIHFQAPPNATKIDVMFRSWFDCLSGYTNWDDASLTLRDLSYRGALTGTYQAEQAKVRSGGKIATYEKNYTGSGYFNVTSAGAYLEWDNVSGGTDGGSRILAFRYALEGGEKNWEVFVNGVSQGEQRSTGTGYQNSWASFDWKVNLKPGNNRVRVKVLSLIKGPNIDKLDVFQAAGSGTPTVSMPTITPNGGTFSNSVKVSLATTTAGAKIYYTTNGTTPSTSSTQYTGAFTLSNTATVKALAVASGYNKSSVASATFTKSTTPTAATPTISPNGGSFSSSVKVSLATTTAGAKIYYTTNGTTPSTSSTQYTGAFTLSNTATVKALAVASGYNKSSVASATFTKSATPTAATPIISPNGGSFSSSVKVSLATTTAGAKIYYTTNGATPSASSALYTGAFTLTSNTTVKAVAVASGYNNSAVAIAEFTKTTSGGNQEAYGGTPWLVPGTIEAENYDLGGESVGYHDRTPGNKGNLYRKDDVDIWYSSTEGYYTGANADGEWLAYTINVEETGQYSFDVVVATPNSGRSMHAELDGVNITGKIAIPNTGSWHDYQTVMSTVTLKQGQHVLKVIFDSGGFDFNRIEIGLIGGGAGGDESEAYGGTPWLVPGTIEAENYDLGGESVGYHDRTPGNKGNLYRKDDVDIWYSSTEGYYTGANADGEWLAYTINVEETGQYSFDVVVATPNSGRSMHAELDGVNITGKIAIPNTGSWHDYQTVMSTVTLKQGQHVLKVIFDSGGFDFNRIEIGLIGGGAGGDESEAYGGTPWLVPGTIEAENYDLGGESVGYHDRTAGNKGGQYRKDDVDIWYSSTEGYYTGGNANGEWLAYTINVEETGQYSFDVVVATPNSGRSMHAELDGVNITGKIAIPNTGSWHDYQTVMSTVTLKQGQHVLKVVSDQGGFDFNRMIIK